MNITLYSISGWVPYMSIVVSPTYDTVSLVFLGTVSHSLHNEKENCFNVSLNINVCINIPKESEVELLQKLVWMALYLCSLFIVNQRMNDWVISS